MNLYLVVLLAGMLPACALPRLETLFVVSALGMAPAFWTMAAARPSGGRYARRG